AHCPDCGSFDAFIWRPPSGAGAVLPYAAGAFAEAAGPGSADTGAQVEILPPDVEPAPVPARD
ncbi:MAG: hypothetical protein VCD66_12790, partial [Alphaproteobacteria bacterium]